MSVKNEISPLNVGDVALRVRVEWRGEPARPVVVNTQAVWVVAVSTAKDGRQIVAWTNGLSRRGGGEFRCVCDRRELLSLDALAAELSPTDAPLPELAASESPNPAAAA